MTWPLQATSNGQVILMTKNIGMLVAILSDCPISYRGSARLFVGCVTSQQHASVSQGRICSDNFAYCHTEIEAADQTFHLTQSQYTDTGPSSPSTDPLTPDAWQYGNWSANFEVTGMIRPLEKSRRGVGVGISVSVCLSLCLYLSASLPVCLSLSLSLSFSVFLHVSVSLSLPLSLPSPPPPKKKISLCLLHRLSLLPTPPPLSLSLSLSLHCEGKQTQED